MLGKGYDEAGPASAMRDVEASPCEEDEVGGLESEDESSRDDGASIVTLGPTDAVVGTVAMDEG